MTGKPPLFSMVAPCYNEERNLRPLVEAFSAVREKMPGGSGLELILVDNGSSDDTAAELARLLPLYGFGRSLRVEVNRGYGFGILSGLAASGEYVGWTHADLQFDPSGVANLERKHGESTWNRGFRDRLRLSLRTIISSFRIRAGLRQRT